MELQRAEYEFGRRNKLWRIFNPPKDRVPGCGSQQYVGEAIPSKTLHTSSPPPPPTPHHQTPDQTHTSITPKTKPQEDSRPRSGAGGGVSMASDRAIKAGKWNHIQATPPSAAIKTFCSPKRNQPLSMKFYMFDGVLNALLLCIINTWIGNS